MARDSAPVGSPPDRTVFGVDRLIVGTSGSPGSLQALRYGESLARAHHAVLVPVIAWELPGGDVLVMGAGRRGTLGRLVFAKVGHYCVAHAQCPVMAVPPPALVREFGHGRPARIFWRRSLTPERVLGDHSGPVA
jgi:nucleotide-binding universal stress UspA family protein